MQLYKEQDEILRDQKEQLKQRPPKGLTEEEQWYLVFRIVFPSYGIPESPYPDDSLEMAVFDFGRKVQAILPSVINQKVSEGDAEAPHGLNLGVYTQFFQKCLGEALDRARRELDYRRISDGHVQAPTPSTSESSVYKSPATCSSSPSLRDCAPSRTTLTVEDHRAFVLDNIHECPNFWRWQRWHAHAFVTYIRSSGSSFSISRISVADRQFQLPGCLTQSATHVALRYC